LHVPGCLRGRAAAGHIPPQCKAVAGRSALPIRAGGGIRAAGAAILHGLRRIGRTELTGTRSGSIRD
jgi:hypothetical protein